MLATEGTVRGEDGKKFIRKQFSDDSNYPMACGQCYRALGILHTDPISEFLYLESDVKRTGNDTLDCPGCEQEHDMAKYLGVSENNSNGTDEFPTEARVKLEDLGKYLKSR